MSETFATTASMTVGREPTRNRRWWILAVLSVAQLMIILDTTIVNIALPSAQSDLRFSNADRQWVVTAYALAFGSLLLIGGRLVDSLGRKRSLLIGLAGFAVASALGGAAVNLGMLVTARAVQGGFGAILAPATLAVLTTTFTDEKERAKAFGIFASVAGAGAAAGLLLGGVLTQYATWRWTLYVNLAFAAVSFIGAQALLAHEDGGGRRRGSDPVGTITITLGLFGLVYGFSNAERHGWTNIPTIALLIAAAVLVTAFALVENRASRPIMPMRVILDRNRGGALLVMLLAGIAIFSELLFLTYYLQRNLGYSPIRSGLAFLPQTASTITVATLGSAILVKKFSARALIPTGMTAAAIGMFLLTRISVEGEYASVVLPAVILIGGGFGLVFAIAINLGVQGVEPDDAGVASALVNAVQQIGGSVGISLFNTLAASVSASYITSHTRGGADTPPSSQLLAHAAVQSYTVAFWLAAAVCLTAAILSALLLHEHRRPAKHDDDTVASAVGGLS